MRPEYRALQRLGQMSEESATQEDIDRFVEATDQLPAPGTEDEIEVILQTLPRNGETYYGVAWTLLHCLEASPLWVRVAGRYERPSYEPEDEWLETLQRRVANGHSKHRDL